MTDIDFRLDAKFVERYEIMLVAIDMVSKKLESENKNIPYQNETEVYIMFEGIFGEKMF